MVEHNAPESTPTPPDPTADVIQRLVDAAPDLNPTALARLAKVVRQIDAALHADTEDELRAWLRTMYCTALQDDDAINPETGLPVTPDEEVGA